MRQTLKTPNNVTYSLQTHAHVGTHTEHVPETCLPLTEVSTREGRERHRGAGHQRDISLVCTISAFCKEYIPSSFHSSLPTHLPSTHVSIHLSILLPACLPSTHLSIRLSSHSSTIHSSICLSIHPSFLASSHPSIHPSRSCISGRFSSCC